MSAANHYLVSFEDVSATVGGYDISSILELQLSAVANDIPQITLLVDAGHSNGGKPQAAAAMTLNSARQVLDTCRGMVKKSGATLSLSLTVRAVGAGGGDTQKLAINGWLLTDVSLSPVQESGVCTVALTFMHPICKSHFGGAVPGLLAAPLSFTELSGDNPLDVFVSALQVYGEEAARREPLSVSVDGASDSETVRNNLLQRLSQAVSALSSSVAWKGGGLPAESQLGAWSSLIRYGLTVYAMPSGGNSVFQRFAKLLVPECSLALGGDYTKETLDVGPFCPWGAAALSIGDNDIISLQFPQNDPSPLSGVKLTTNDTGETVMSSYHLDTSQLQVRPADIFYVPDSELGAEFLYGPIQQFQEPGWMTHMKSYMQNVSDTWTSDASVAQDGLYRLAVNTDVDAGADAGGAEGKIPDADYSAAMLACAKAYYETSLMKDWSFSVNARLLFRSSGQVICPGQVLAVKSGNGDVLSGYVIGVTHTISVANRSAHSSVTCSHPRFGSPPESITSSENALYS